jgi:shikimate kinase/3-dehydroquinate synthase
LPIVRAAVEAKIRIVRDDEREAGIRAVLNLGHTVGHALEAHGGYARWLHGEAVALGVVAELAATARLGWTPPALVDRARALVGALGLPVEVERAELAASWPFVGSDKKRAGGAVRLPVVTGPGECHIEAVPLRALHDAVLPA